MTLLFLRCNFSIVILMNVSVVNNCLAKWMAWFPAAHLVRGFYKSVNWFHCLIYGAFKHRSLENNNAYCVSWKYFPE